MKMWGFFSVGIVCSIIPINVVLFTALHESAYPAWMRFLVCLVCLLSMCLGAVSCLLFNRAASEKPDESIGAIQRLAIASFLGFISVVAAFALIVLLGVLFRVDVSFLGEIRPLIVSLLIGALLCATVCSSTQQSLRFRLRPRVIQLEEPKK